MREPISRVGWDAWENLGDRIDVGWIGVSGQYLDETDEHRVNDPADRALTMPPHHFNLASLMLVVTAICAILALFVTSNPFVQTVAGAVIAANVIGAIAALIITHGLGFPRDGSLRNDDPD